MKNGLVKKTRVKLMKVASVKVTKPIGPRQGELLQAIKKVVNDMQDYWPLTIRQIHYRLLNDPPLTQVTKDRNERWRYKNNQSCYNLLSAISVPARYLGHIPFEAIGDETRECIEPWVFENAEEFIDHEMRNFLRGYRLDPQLGQTKHVKVVVEKNTLLNIVKDLCVEFGLNLTPLRGFGGPSVWKLIEERYQDSGKDRLLVIILSDHDPEGLKLADDCYSSLRDCHHIAVDAIRPLITMEQARRLRLPPNPAKEESANFAAYVKRTRTTDTWECEALEPEVIQQILRDAVEQVIDVRQFRRVQAQQQHDAADLESLRTRTSNYLQRIARR
jgi:hypothetical protein